MNDKHQRSCPDCEPRLDRRTFVKAVGGAAALSALAPLAVHGAPTAESSAETAAARFFKSLTDEQKKTVAFPFDHELRSRISANWHITKPLIGDKDFYTKEQQATIEEIVKNVCSADGYDRLLKQTEYDDGGISAYSVAVFGEPGKKFQFELTGRHLTLRADGDSVDKAAFGGPIVYGHGEEDAKNNLYNYQTKQVNEVFAALDAKQRERALVKQAPKEDAVKIQGDKGAFPGMPVGELSADQKALVEKTLKVLLSPYRQEDVDEVFAILKAGGGFDKLHCAFYQQGDLDDDKVWDIWRVEGPSFVWHFRGAPHVHAYINIGQIG